MSIQPIEGKVISTPSATRADAQRRYSYYYTRDSGTTGTSTPPGGGGGSTGGTGRRWAARISAEPRRVSTPSGVPSFMGNRAGLAGAWVISMVIIGFDEWHNNGILPRPARLWSASLFYGILALVSIYEPIVPLVNLMAFGYVIMLLWQYFNGQGQFAKEGA